MPTKPISQYADMSRPGPADTAYSKADLAAHGTAIETFFSTGCWDRAVENVRADIMSEWTKTETPADREALFARLQALEHVQARLTYGRNRGMIAAREIEQDRERETMTARRGQHLREA